MVSRAPGLVKRIVEGAGFSYGSVSSDESARGCAMTGHVHVRVCVGLCTVALVAFALTRFDHPTPAQDPKTDAKPTDYATTIQPLVKKYCLGCHSTKAKKGSLDLERFATLDDLRKDLKVWQAVIEQIEAAEMPPKEKAQP